MMDGAKLMHLQDTTVLHSTYHNIFVCGDGDNELYMENAKILTTAKDTNGLRTHIESHATVEIVNSFVLDMSNQSSDGINFISAIFSSTVVSLLVMVEMGCK